MHEQIRKTKVKERKGRDLPLWVGLAVSVALLLSVIIPVIIGARAQNLYHTVMREMSQSVFYSRNHASAWIYVGEERQFQRADVTSGLLVMIADAGAGKPQKELPDTESVRIEFGDGASLQIWYAKVKGNYGGQPEDGLFLSYVNPEGERWSYTTHYLDAKTLIPYMPDIADEWLEEGLAQMDPEY